MLNHFISIVGFGCLVIGYYETKDIVYLTKYGVSTEATIVDVEFTMGVETKDMYYCFQFCVRNQSCSPAFSTVLHLMHFAPGVRAYHYDRERRLGG